MIDLHQLRTFTLVAEKKSFSAAADAMLLTQPTVSSHIKNLEETLGVTLFDRLPRKAELTKAGHILYRYSREILALHRCALDAVQEFCGRLIGSLEIGGSTIPGEYILPVQLGEFHRRAPEVEVTLRIGDSREITELVLEGKLEVGMVGALPEHEQLESVSFCRDTLVVISGAGHPLFRRGLDTISLKDLLTFPLWLREPGSGTRQTLAEALGRKGKQLKDLKIIGQLGSTEAVKHAVMAGDGLAVVSSLAIRDDVACGRLRAYRLLGMASSRSFYIIRHRQRTPSPAARFLHAFLVESGPSFQLP